MDVFDLFDPNACDIRGKVWSDTWTWSDFFENKKNLKENWIDTILVDMINHPVLDSVSISNELFFEKKYPKWTHFALYCHSWWSSGYVQKQLKPQLPEYVFINMEWWIWAYKIYQMQNNIKN